MKETEDFNTFECAVVIHRHISSDLKRKLNISQIDKIVNLELDYLEQEGIVDDEDSEYMPMVVDGNKMGDYVIRECAMQGIIITEEDYDEILDAEQKYYQQLYDDNFVIYMCAN